MEAVDAVGRKGSPCSSMAVLIGMVSQGPPLHSCNSLNSGSLDVASDEGRWVGVGKSRHSVHL